MMGNSFILVNRYNNEYIRFCGLGKTAEIIGNRIPAKMVAYFLFENNGRPISFIGDQWNIGVNMWLSYEDVLELGKDITLEVLHEMLEEGHITEEGLDSFYPQWRGAQSSTGRTNNG